MIFPTVEVYRNVNMDNIDTVILRLYANICIYLYDKLLKI